MLEDEAWFQERVLVLLYEYNGVTEYACRDKACASFGGLSMSIVETDPVNIRNPFMSVTNTYLASLKKKNASSEKRSSIRKERPPQKSLVGGASSGKRDRERKESNGSQLQVLKSLPLGFRGPGWPAQSPS
jgi:hypothetical protein